MEIRLAKEYRKGKYRSNYNINDMSKAYLLVKDKGVSVESAARKCGVPVTTLKDRVRGRINIETIKSGPSPLFSLDEELNFFNHINIMAEIGYGYTRRETLNLASDYAVHLGYRDQDHPLSFRWLKNFLSRWPAMKVQKPRKLEAVRAKCTSKEVIDRYFKELKTILDKYNLNDQPGRIFNVDEKGITTDYKPPNVVAGTNLKVQAVVTGKSKTVTVIGAGNAIGNQVPPFFVFPGQRMMPELLDGATPGVQGRVSLSGWSNSEIFDEYMKEHLINYLPAHDASNKVLIACRVYTKTLTPSNFQSAFKKCGIFPYNPDVIPEVALAPSQSFPVDDVLTSASVVDVECPTTVKPSDVAMAVEEEKANSPNVPAPSDFFDKQGGEVLKNLKVRKVRKTLSKVVGGKPITEDCVMEAVQKHYAEQKNPKKSIKNAVNESQVAGCSGEGNKRKRPVETLQNKKKPKNGKSSNVAVSSSDDGDSSSDEIQEEEKCCICKKFSMPGTKYSVVFTKWVQCEKCPHWVHVQTCTPSRVIRRGDIYVCPHCTSE
ncbi:hypothetical protein KUTeg_011600 [Tegillarca granosa]|uniref:HTH CENPB-type domain-containing protein n=1 Tax=Tegillarca granosa TaxID=220873 RepID=A0ABQ9F2B8_TEGGR|nr:hypothetical protein KUTeg_011600 [Tegillarca granosa]